MARCTYINSCPFPKDKLTKMPVTTGYMVDNYCNWDFTRCSIYKTAIARNMDKMSGDRIHEECLSSEKILSMLICGGIV